MDVECVSVSDYATSFNDTHITSNTTGSAPGLFSQDFRLSGFVWGVLNMWLSAGAAAPEPESSKNKSAETLKGKTWA